jgi:hypothetical protein
MPATHTRGISDFGFDGAGNGRVDSGWLPAIGLLSGSARAYGTKNSEISAQRTALETHHSPGTRNLTVLVMRSASSTVDIPQSASNAIFHSYLSESRGGPGPTWLSEGGWAGGGGGKKE